MSRLLKRISLIAVFALVAFRLDAQPAGYYSSAAGLTGTSLRSALHNIIDNHNSLSYNSLWTYFEDTDKKSNGKVWDMYSNCQFYFDGDQCGSYDSECDCYNREHSWPKSWFNDQSVPRTDLHHIFPTDGYVNNKRGNMPFGEVGSATWTSSTSGSKLGYCSYPGYSGIVFEPVDEYKGDFARVYFYMCTRYYGEDSSWEETDMTDGAELKPWALQMMMQWHENDPVSQKEINRNNAVYQVQGNRNPFIDNPEYVAMIWDPNWQGSVDDCVPPSYVSSTVDKNDVTLTWNSVAEATDYQIFRNGDAIAIVTGTTTYTDTSLLVGNYCYRVMTYCIDGISEQSDETCVEVNYVSVPENDGVAFRVFPNPVGAGQQVRIATDTPFAGVIEVYDLSGRIVFGQMVDGESEVSIALPLEAGFYMVSVAPEGGRAKVHKLVVR